MVGSIRVSKRKQKSQVNPPTTIADQAPKMDAFFQKNPKVNGAKIQTRIRLNEATTKPTMSESLKANTQDISATTTTEIRVKRSKRLSVMPGR